MTSKLRGSTPDDFVVTGLLAPVSAAGSRRPREALQRSWLSWISIQGRTKSGRDLSQFLHKLWARCILLARCIC